ncbi:MAG: rod shape-determining protein [Lachnospiraceae bacterium]|nr:rod shape-determining protein [Lachnospiraceae bacterium]MBR5732486.1 rod shape-determining protein [Lachnospiraceae bacterium]
MNEQLVFGLDIGTRSIVGTVGYRRHSHDFTIVAQTVRFHETRSMLDGQIHDINAVAGTIGEVRRELEQKLNLKLADVCIAAAGRVLKTMQVRTDYELGDEMVITDELIRSMELIGVEQAHEELRKKVDSTFFCVDHSVIKYYLGDIPITNLEGHKGRRIGADIIATFLPQDVIDGLYAATQRANLNVVNLTLEPIAAINVAIPEKFRLLNLALVDIGAGTSDICITKGGSVTAYGMLPKAGDFLTEAIMQKYLVEFKTAEDIKIALSSKKKKINYLDIMGLKQTVSADDVRNTIDSAVGDLATGIAKQICELNGGKPVSAIFLVGGGGKVPGFTDRLAAAAKLAKERVALRGDEVLGEIRFLDNNIVKDSTLITPIGICLNYYEQNNNFVFVKCNGDLVKLYDNGRLTVMDAAAGVGFPNEKLFPRRGKELEFSVNGQRRLIRGEPGESATVTVNGNPASVSSPIIRNDIIEIQESTAGPDAHASISDIAEAGRSISFYVNGKRIICPRLVYRGSECVTEGTEIRNGDDIKVLDYYTVDKLIEYMDVAREGTVLVNNIIALGNEKVYENFSVDFGIVAEEFRREEEPKAAPAAAPAEKKTVNPVTVIVNGQPVVLTGREKYKLVDVLDFYEFDTSGHSGKEAVIRVNGKPADFTAPVGENSQIELYWKK